LQITLRARTLTNLSHAFSASLAFLGIESAGVQIASRIGSSDINRGAIAALEERLPPLNGGGESINA
jgi:hypothetical protein